MRTVLVIFMLTLASCFSSGDHFHDKIGMGKDKSHFAEYLEVELLNHVDSLGRGNEHPDCKLKDNCKFYYGRGLPGSPFEDQGLNVKTDANDKVQNVLWWFKFNPNFISLHLEKIKSFPTALERFKNSKPSHMLEIRGSGLPVKQFRLFWKTDWGGMRADVMCFNKESEEVRNCHVIEYWVTYKTPQNYWKNVEANIEKDPSSKTIAW